MTAPEQRPLAGTPAVLLLSGGLDSTTMLAQALRDGYRVTALTFRYGQRHDIEITAAARIAAYYDLPHHVVDIDLRTPGGSALTGDLAVPKDRPIHNFGSGGTHDIPATYVPARNIIFLSLALAWAEVVAATDIFIGVNAIDYSGYPDCRPEFLAAFELMANLGTRTGVEGGAPIRIRAPLVHMTKRDIVLLGKRLDVDHAMTVSCYDPDASGAACGRCDACALRIRGFAEAALRDPTPYQHASLTPS
jgi:7-cyano-7-deazaguanine synthase